MRACECKKAEESKRHSTGSGNAAQVARQFPLKFTPWLIAYTASITGAAHTQASI